MMFLAYVMRRAGTFSMEDKVKMIEYLGYMALNPNRVVNPSIANLLKLSLGGERTNLLDGEIFGSKHRCECQCGDYTSRSHRIHWILNLLKDVITSHRPVHRTPKETLHSSATIENLSEAIFWDWFRLLLVLDYDILNRLGRGTHDWCDTCTTLSGLTMHMIGWLNRRTNESAHFIDSKRFVSLNHSKKVERGGEEIRLEEEMRYQPLLDDHSQAQSQASKNPERIPRH